MNPTKWEPPQLGMGLLEDEGSAQSWNFYITYKHVLLLFRFQHHPVRNRFFSQQS